MREEDVRQLGKELLDLHGLSDWRLFVDNAKTIAGRCWYNQKVISISGGYVKKATDAQIRNTLLHEISHALAGPGSGHDAKWQRIALRIGCDAKSCHDVRFTDPQWHVFCPCGVNDFMRIKVTKSLRDAICKVCNQPLKIERVTTVAD